MRYKGKLCSLISTLNPVDLLKVTEAHEAENLSAVTFRVNDAMLSPPQARLDTPIIPQKNILKQ